MIAEIEKQYTKEALIKAEKHDNIYNVFDDLMAKIEVFSFIDTDGSSLLKTGLYLYAEDLKDTLQGLEFQLKRDILEGTLKV